MLNILILIFVFLGFGFYLAYGFGFCLAYGGSTWVEITFRDGSKIRQETEHTGYTTFGIVKHNGQSRGNVVHALCIHDWNGSISGFRATKETYQELVNKINAKSTQSIIEWDCHEGSVNGWNDLWLDPANITRLENWWGEYVEIRLEGRRLIITPRRL
ncbi:MAG: hypothetical protein Pg6B_10320 [Candidatus Azobacteroides pseudotrichonymphae]|jgi:hypothetical protein|uniref:Uncharacterized protein n=1 Tax=Azobacteroides pseudotrichonymphae genomovar. CFP2 TaxID=511995 RepID=B6YSA4_AZOPC|nr:hypothetical protein [Candidatus Azobacteroides pseudotrichonymphae]BAG84076.1 hypothetical protein CFPG_P2-18 [Candidatus Azobacteroides pseudotrichonymphae genomovar. CFP2]GMO38094.1 MAG: hypothetical protein Pg6B_10320 [Candidatus Azobacteroides pseudotrichonymphae]